MLPSQRKKSLAFLYEMRNDLKVVRTVEALCHCESSTAKEYEDRIKACSFDLYSNPNLGIDVVFASNEALVEGTLIGQIQKETNLRKENFQKMLDDKYEEMNDTHFKAIVKCRRCGSEDISWDEKMTKSADEAATVFCTCRNCKNRWVMK
jgi:DNA-directed RNA polymerase subunit M/transcription elongation factor TFIIS